MGITANYPEEIWKSTLFMNTMNITEKWITPDNYLLISGKIGNKEIVALIDTGAQPTVIKKSCVPIGTVITSKDLCIKGVQGPKIEICGTADIPIEVGYCILMQNCI